MVQESKERFPKNI